MLLFATSCNKPDEPDNTNGNDLNGHEYVDLGLPSGTLWATCNVGASRPEEFGDYYAWGETETKVLFDWKSYKYGNFTYERYELDKYCTDAVFGLNGFVDDLTVLDPADDVVKVCWGTDWRMPTIEEWEELFMNTTGAWTTLNGVKGWRITASNGNDLFLPAAGYWWDDVFNADLGLYWSASLNKEYPYRSWGFHFNCDSSHLCGSSDRNRGQTVRAVCSGK
jgi:uncharacterized protein (TIGR02145 family)